MKLLVATVGKLRDPNLKALATDYRQRIQRYVNLQSVEVREGRGDASNRCGEEATELTRAATGFAIRYVLDERGTQITSRDFAARFERHMNRGETEIAFLLGGAYGHAESTRAAASFVLALSPMTLPHELAAVVTLEQIYRAFTILRGEPYHK